MSPAIELILWANKRVMVVEGNALIKRDMTVGKLFVEDLPSFYKFAVKRDSISGSLDIDSKYIDAAGKVHLLVEESDGSVNNSANLFYEVYNPNSPTPETPEIRERIE